VPGAARTAHLQPGVYYRVERAGESAIIPVLIFVQSADYKPTLKLSTVVEKTVKAVFDNELDAALTQAIRTAK